MSTTAKKIIAIDGLSLTFEKLIAIAHDDGTKFNIIIKSAAIKRMSASRQYVEEIVKRNGDTDTPFVYGVNTGFGANKHKFVSGTGEAGNNDLAKISYNLIVSHCCSVGEKFPREVVRAAMLLRANTLVRGYSGIRAEVIQKLLDLLNNDITPVVPSQGSVGGSGDLSPLSHMSVVFVRNPYTPESTKLFGKVEMKSSPGKNNKYTVVDATKAMQKIGGGLFLQAKEGLALNNGTQFTTALTAIAVHKAEKLIAKSLDACSMTCEAMLTTIDAFNPLIHKVRPFPYQQKTAVIIKNNLAGSTLVFNPNSKKDYALYHKDINIQKQEKEIGLRDNLQPVKEPLQDIYSIRCTPQAVGAIWDAVEYAKRSVSIECNSVNDNPIINVDFTSERLTGNAISGGNFHGEPIAIVADLLKIVLTELGSISERRTAALIHPEVNRRLPAFVINPVVESGTGMKREEGMHSGMMIPQYLSAALTSENKVLAHPACVDTIPTSNGIEDHVSMGAHGAKQALEIADNVTRIVAVELLVAAQALKLRTRQNLAELYDVDKRLRNAQGLNLEVTRLADTKRMEKCKTLISELNLLKKDIATTRKDFSPGKGSSRILKKVSELFKRNKLVFPLDYDVFLNEYITMLACAIENNQI